MGHASRGEKQVTDKNIKNQNVLEILNSQTQEARKH